MRSREEQIECVARAICASSRKDPDELTYHSVGGGLMEPYGPAWAWYTDEAEAAMDAMSAFNQQAIDAAIQRGRELERAEMGQDTARLDWLERQVAAELKQFVEGWVLYTDLTCRAYDQATARAAIDAAMNAENGNG